MGWIIFILGTIGWHIGIYGMFKKMGVEGWKAFVPFYNTWVIAEACGIKRFWFWLQFIPIVGQFITIWILIIFSMHFGKIGFLEHAAVVFLPFVYLPYLGFDKKVKWGGKDKLKHYSKSPAREWAERPYLPLLPLPLYARLFLRHMLSHRAVWRKRCW